MKKYEEITIIAHMTYEHPYDDTVSVYDPNLYNHIKEAWKDYTE